MRAILPDFQESRIDKERFSHIDEDITQEVIDETIEDFNPEFIERFKASKLPFELLVEFVFAINHLDNLTEMNNFPTNRLITTPDIVNFGPDAAKALSINSPIGAGVAVSEAVLDRVQEFLDRKYVKTIHIILSKLGVKGISFYLDGLYTFVGITYKTEHSRFGILSYRVYDVTDGNPATYIPFLINRLN